MATKKAEAVTISPPNFQYVRLRLVGTAPYMQAKFSEKAKAAMRAKHEAGSQAKKGTKKEARDFDAEFRGAMHVSDEGWVGVPASALRNACVDVCRMVGFKMTHAKMSVFVVADGLDADSGDPLVKLHADEPERMEMHTRNATGVCDLRVRPMWRKWSLDVTLRFDADQFSTSDVVNLVARAGMQVGIGEGRPYSRQSNGLGFGTFEIGEANDA